MSNGYTVEQLLESDMPGWGVPFEGESMNNGGGFFDIGGLITGLGAGIANVMGAYYPYSPEFTDYGGMSELAMAEGVQAQGAAALLAQQNQAAQLQALQQQAAAGNGNGIEIDPMWLAGGAAVLLGVVFFIRKGK